MERKTVVISAMGGAGVGKTTACFHVACELKKRGYVTEYVPEYSKELVWEENWELLDGSLEHQIEILKEQKRRLDRLVGKVDFIVTDAPLLLNSVYLKDCPEKEAHKKYLLSLFNEYNNFIFVVKRDASKYEQEGRMQTLEESIEKDRAALNLLDESKLVYGVYDQMRLSDIVTNAEKVLKKLNNPKWNIVYCTIDENNTLKYDCVLPKESGEYLCTCVRCCDDKEINRYLKVLYFDKNKPCWKDSVNALSCSHNIVAWSYEKPMDSNNFMLNTNGYVTRKAI